MYGASVERRFAGERWTACEYRGSNINRIGVVDEIGLSTRPGFIHCNLNSGAGLVNLVALWGVARIVLLGYDMMRGPNGESHHHGDHEGGLPNLGTLGDWAARMGPIARDLAERGVEILNCSRRTAIDANDVPRVELKEALKPKPPLIFSGMHGMGDNLHQRAVVRAALKTNEVWLETPWPSVYHDFPVNLVRKATALRTQAKNSKREEARYSPLRPPRFAAVKRIWYTHDGIRKAGGFLGAMTEYCGVKATLRDIRLPIPKEWDERLHILLGAWKPRRPIMLYRPLVERTEWPGCAARNPDPVAYLALVRAIRERFYVVSVADLEPGKESLFGKPLEADVTLHAGELPFELLAALAARSSLVFTSPGFAIILAQAVGARLVTVFGGHESSRFYNHGDPKHHWIDTVAPCECFSQVHRCDKRIDLPRAIAKLEVFVCA